MGRNIGRGFFILKTKDQDTVQQLLLATPYRGTRGLCIFQRWTADFEPKTLASSGSKSALPASMKIPTWVTLKQIPEEFQAVAMEIAEGIGELIGLDSSNDHSQDPRFCIALDSSKGWESEVYVTNETTQITKKILIDYNLLPIRCRFCLDTQHCVKDCPERNATLKNSDHGPISKPNAPQHTGNRYRRGGDFNREGTAIDRHDQQGRRSGHQRQDWQPRPRYQRPLQTEDRGKQSRTDEEGFTKVTSKQQRRGRGPPVLVSRWDEGPDGRKREQHQSTTPKTTEPAETLAAGASKSATPAPLHTEQ